jgi:hypothetical protein
MDDQYITVDLPPGRVYVKEIQAKPFDLSRAFKQRPQPKSLGKAEPKYCHPVF